MHVKIISNRKIIGKLKKPIIRLTMKINVKEFLSTTRLSIVIIR